MSIEENKAKARRAYEEGWNDRRLQVFDELYADDFVYHDPDLPGVRSREDYKQWVARQRSTDIHVAIEDMFAEGDRVAARGTFSYTAHGEVWGVPVTGKHVQFTWISIFRFAGGKIAELWNNWDHLGALRQMGVVSPPG